MKTKTLSTFLLLICLSCSTSNEHEQGVVVPTASEIIEKCIGHYDPSGSWDSYSGKVHLNTIFRDRTGEEILEINNKTGFYQSTRLDTKDKIIRGIKDGACIHMIGENSDLTDEQIEANNLSCEIIAEVKEHHTSHFGFILNMERAGIIINDDVSEDNFNGWDCYVISHKAEESEVVHNYYMGEGKLYIDKINYKLRGRTVNHPDYPPRKMIYNGEATVGSIIMPEVVVYFENGSPQFMFVDIFRTVDG